MKSTQSFLKPLPTLYAFDIRFRQKAAEQFSENIAEILKYALQKRLNQMFHYIFNIFIN